MKWMLQTFLVSFLLSSSSLSQPIGVVLAVQGKVEAQDTKGSARVLERKSAIFRQDTIKVGEQSKAQLRFSDGTLISVSENSTFQVETYKHSGSADDEMRATLQTGGVRALPGKIDSAKTKSLQISSPVAVMGVVGTLLSVATSKDHMAVGVFQGNAWLKNNSSEVSLGEQQSFDFAKASSEPDSPPQGLLVEPEALGALEHKLFVREIGDKSAMAIAMQEASAVRPLSGSDLQNIRAAAQSGGRFGTQARLKNRDRQVEFRAENIDCQ